MKLRGDVAQHGVGGRELLQRQEPCGVAVGQATGHQVGEDPDAVHLAHRETGGREQLSERLSGETAGGGVSVAPAAERVRQDILSKHGVQNIGVPILRELRGELPES